jgi:hypothetical protein
MVLGLGGVSCTPFDQSFFPMRMGQTWTFQVQDDFDRYVDDVRVVGAVNVGPVKGWQLRGKMGTSRLGWSGDTLLASELGGRHFDPPLPIFSRSPRSWKGTMFSAGMRTPVAATVTSEKTVEKYGGRSYDAVQTTVLLTGAGQQVKLDSWFVSGIGLLRQEQRTGDRRDRRIEYLYNSQAK